MHAPLPAATLAALAAILTAVSLAEAAPADRIIRGGPIVTVHAAQPTAEAVAIAGGRIVAVGSEADVMQHKGDATEVIDLAGKTLAPGFVDGHSHFCSLIDVQTQALCASPPAGGCKTVADVIAFARAKPGMAQFASAGNGSMAHMSMELFAAMAKIEAVHIPYKGSGAALPDVMGGHVPFMIDNLGSAMPHVRGGKLKAIAHTGTGRLEMLPGVPAIADAPGMAGYETSNWFGFLAPAKMPAALSERIHGELVKVIRRPDIVERFARDGVEAVGNSKADFAAFLKAEMVKWGRVVKERNIKVE
jgi:hypothetical protein